MLCSRRCLATQLCICRANKATKVIASAPLHFILPISKTGDCPAHFQFGPRFGLETYLQGDHGSQRLHFIDFFFLKFYNFILLLSAISAQFAAAQAESGRQWPNLNPGQQILVADQYGHPVHSRHMAWVWREEINFKGTFTLFPFWGYQSWFLVVVGLWISWTKPQTLPNLRLPISSGGYTTNGIEKWDSRRRCLRRRWKARAARRWAAATSSRCWWPSPACRPSEPLIKIISIRSNWAEIQFIRQL